jgi:hypothetical protein
MLVAEAVLKNQRADILPVVQPLLRRRCLLARRNLWLTKRLVLLEKAGP